MKSYRFLSRTWIYIDAENIEEAVDKFNNVDLGCLDSMIEDVDEDEPGITTWEEHSVQTVEEEVDGTYKPVDHKMLVSTPRIVSK